MFMWKKKQLRLFRICGRKIRKVDLIKKLARFHEDPEHTFQNWNNIWLTPEFGSWNILEYVSQIKCPILAIQGEMDEYGTMAQIDDIAQKMLSALLLE